MKIDAQRNSILMILILFCTMTIILTNYIFTQRVVTDINNTIMESEYKKIGGKENYLIMQEIQKREIIGYIDTIKKDQPELIKEILKEQNVEESNYKTLGENIINDLKKDTSIVGSSGALISIIEFSDLECPYCIKQHKSGINNKALENHKDDLNYIFKNFPIPAHKNAMPEAQAAKCVESIEGTEKYMLFLDKMFETTKGGGEGFKIEDLAPLAVSLEIEMESFEKCMSEPESKNKVEKEFKQGVMLGINSVPSTLIVNNETGKYTIVTEVMDYDSLEKIINEIKK